MCGTSLDQALVLTYPDMTDSSSLFRFLVSTLAAAVLSPINISECCLHGTAEIGVTLRNKL